MIKWDFRRNLVLRSPKGSGSLALNLAIICIILFYVVNGRFVELLPFSSTLRDVFNAIQISICVYGIASAFGRNLILSSIVSSVVLVSVPFYAYIFGAISGMPVQFLSGAMYLTGAMTVIMHRVILSGDLNKVLRFLYSLSVVYSVLYSGIWFVIDAGLIAPPETSQILLGNGGGVIRGTRLTLSNSLVIYGLFCSLVYLRSNVALKSVGMVALFSFALYLSGSRILTALLLLCSCFYIMFSLRVSVYTFLVIGAFVYIFSLFMFAMQGFNPFSAFVDEQAMTGDVSAWARWRSVEIANTLLKSYWVTGIGIPHGATGYAPLTGVNYFFPQDLGVFGIGVTFGVPGLCYYFMIFMALIFSLGSLSRIDAADRGLAEGLVMAGLVMHLYSIIAPVYAGNAIPFGCIFMAIALSRVTIRRG